jgi:hypothetical protein
MTGSYAGLKLTIVPGAGKPKTESAWAFGRGPKMVKKKQTIMVRFKDFLNMLGNFLRTMTLGGEGDTLIKGNTYLRVVKLGRSNEKYITYCNVYIYDKSEKY